MSDAKYAEIPPDLVSLFFTSAAITNRGPDRYRKLARLVPPRNIADQLQLCQLIESALAHEALIHCSETAATANHRRSLIWVLENSCGIDSRSLERHADIYFGNERSPADPLDDFLRDDEGARIPSKAAETGADVLALLKRVGLSEA